MEVVYIFIDLTNRTQIAVELDRIIGSQMRAKLMRYMHEFGLEKIVAVVEGRQILKTWEDQQWKTVA